MEDMEVDNDVDDTLEDKKAAPSKMSAKKASNELSDPLKREALGYLGLHEMCDLGMEAIAMIAQDQKEEFIKEFKKRHKNLSKKFKAFIDDPEKVWDAVQKNQEYLASVPHLSQTVRDGLSQVYNLESLKGNDSALNGLKEQIIDPEKYPDNQAKYRQVSALSELADNELWRRMSSEFVEKVLSPYRKKKLSGQRGPQRGPTEVAVRAEYLAQMEAKKKEVAAAQKKKVNDAKSILQKCGTFISPANVLLNDDQMNAAKNLLPDLEKAMTSIESVRTVDAAETFLSLTNARTTILQRCITEEWAVAASQHLGGMSTSNQQPPSAAVPALGAARANRKRPGRGELSDTKDPKEVTRSFKNEQRNINIHLAKMVQLIEKLWVLSQAEEGDLDPEEGVEVDDGLGPDAAPLNEINEQIKKQEDDLLKAYTQRRELKESAGQRLPQDGPKFASIAVLHSLYDRQPMFTSGYAGDFKLTPQQEQDAKFATQILMERNALGPPKNRVKLKAKRSRILTQGKGDR